MATRAGEYFASEFCSAVQIGDNNIMEAAK
jgi:hypothetical protein